MLGRSSWRPLGAPGQHGNEAIDQVPRGHLQQPLVCLHAARVCHKGKPWCALTAADSGIHELLRIEALARAPRDLRAVPEGILLRVHVERPVEGD